MTYPKQLQEEFILLTEAGFIAINQGDEDAATKLFNAAELIKPADNLPRVGKGYMHFLKLELKQACAVFEQILVNEPSNDMAEALLGLCVALSPNQTLKGEKMLVKTMEATENPAVKSMTQTAIEFIDKYVKKGPPPTMGRKDTKKGKKPPKKHR